MSYIIIFLGILILVAGFTWGIFRLCKGYQDEQDDPMVRFFGPVSFLLLAAGMFLFMAENKSVSEIALKSYHLRMKIENRLQESDAFFMKDPATRQEKRREVYFQLYKEEIPE